MDIMVPPKLYRMDYLDPGGKRAGWNKKSRKAAPAAWTTMGF
jgi:hypothetical protein